VRNFLFSRRCLLHFFEYSLLLLLPPTEITYIAANAITGLGILPHSHMSAHASSSPSKDGTSSSMILSGTSAETISSSRSSSSIISKSSVSVPEWITSDMNVSFMESLSSYRRYYRYFDDDDQNTRQQHNAIPLLMPIGISNVVIHDTPPPRTTSYLQPPHQ
jgi:hypothetical protein